MSLSDPPHENAPLPATMLGMMTKKSRIFSEDDLGTFEGWLEAVQGIDPTKAAPDDLAKWRALFDDSQSREEPRPGFQGRVSTRGCCS